MTDESGATSIAVGVVAGRVVMTFQKPTSEIVFDPENCRQIAEGMARAAHEAHTGQKPVNGGSAISAQMHERAVNRMVIMLNNYDKNQNRAKKWWAQEMVSAIRNILG